MTTFQQIALLLIAIWFTLIVVYFRRSTVILVLGLVIVGLYTLVSLFLGNVTRTELGLLSLWLPAAEFAILGLAISLTYSPLADRLFVLSGYNLWTVILCHGLYDTIAFIRFANKTS